MFLVMENESKPNPPFSFRNQALPFPEDLMEELHRVFAGCRARVAAAVEARPRNITLEQARAQVRRFSILSGKTDEERKKIIASGILD
jgi:hypothetical protein